jgi:hypothetical protein
MWCTTRRGNKQNPDEGLMHGLIGKTRRAAWWVSNDVRMADTSRGRMQASEEDPTSCMADSARANGERARGNGPARDKIETAAWARHTRRAKDRLALHG